MKDSLKLRNTSTRLLQLMVLVSVLIMSQSYDLYGRRNRDFHTMDVVPQAPDIKKIGKAATGPDGNSANVSLQSKMDNRKHYNNIAPYLRLIKLLYSKRKQILHNDYNSKNLLQIIKDFKIQSHDGSENSKHKRVPDYFRNAPRKPLPPSRLRTQIGVCSYVCGYCSELIPLRYSPLCWKQCTIGHGKVFHACLTLMYGKSAGLTSLGIKI